MNNSRYKSVLYFIGGVILITLCIQLYWNYRNYVQGKQQLLNEVQISLDNAVEKYYASGTRRSTRRTIEKGFISPGIRFEAPPQEVLSDSAVKKILRSVEKEKVVIGDDFATLKYGDHITVEEIKGIKIINSQQDPASLDSLVGRILFSLVNDTLDLKKMSSLVKEEFARKGIGVKYGLQFNRRGQVEQQINSDLIEKASLTTESKSTWLPRAATLTLFFTNETATILRANMVGLLLSALLMAAVIGCLLFLLKIIRDQKQLADLKNDIIGNITHEFKTPIATISVAMEGILHFNEANDPVKTISYIQTSNLQLEKLNSMVEKLLETATLSGKKLALSKEEIDLVSLMKNLSQKWQELAPHKNFFFQSNCSSQIFHADQFHLENAFNNIFDNAVKYGGKNISTSVDAREDFLNITISDSGSGLTRTQADQIFDKFYRVPKGNTHDIKGFGIGLYYTKEIIKSHGGEIRADVITKTKFLIQLPNE